MSKALKTSIATIILFVMLFCFSCVKAASTYYVRYYWPNTTTKIMEKTRIHSNGTVDLEEFPKGTEIPDNQVFYKWKIGSKEYEAGTSPYVGNSKDLVAYPVFGYEISTEVSGNVGGTISITGDSLIKTGETCKFTISPSTGYEIDKLEIGGSEVDKTTRQFTVSKTAHSIKVTFKKKEFQVAATVMGGNGTITPSSTSVKYDESCTFTLSPEEGYMLDTFEINGGNDISKSITGTTYTLTNIKEDKAVIATYKKIPFKLTVNSVDNATINPTGVIEVYYGDTKDVSIVANDGYKLVSVTVNGNPVTLPLTDDKVTITNITEDKTVNVTVERKTYTVEASVVNDVGGTISAVPTTVNHGEGCTVTLLPLEEQGYEIDSLIVNNVDRTSEISGNTYTIPSVVENIDIKVAYKLKEYTINVNSDVEHGTIVSQQEKVTHGQNCTIVVTPQEGYKIDSLKVNGVEVKDNVTTSDGGITYTYTYAVTSADEANVVVAFKIMTFGISTEVIDGEGRVTANPETVDYGDDCVLTFIPTIGYEIDYVEVNGQKIYGIEGNSYILQNVKQDYEIKVAYKKLPFTLKIDSVEGASIDPTGSITVLYDESKTVSIKANQGYRLISVKVNGEEQELPLTDDKLILTNITEDKTVEVVVEKIKFEVKTSVKGANGTITEGKIVEYGDDFIVKFTPDTGYMIESILVNGHEIKIESDMYKLEDVTEDYTVEVSYTKIPFTLEIKSTDNAIIDPTGTVIVYYGDDKTINIKAARGYKLVKLTVNDVEQTLPLVDDKLELTGIMEDTVVVATVEKETYEVVEGKDQTYDNEGNLTVRFSGDLDLFVKLLINGEELDENKYITESGSTVVKLSQAYLDSLPEGTYTMTAVYSNGNTAETTFTIAREKENNSNNPTTGDTIMISVSALILSAVGTVFAMKKIKKNK